MRDAVVRLRPAVAELTTYRPPPVPVGPDGTSYRLSANEAGYPPLSSVQGAIAAETGRLNRYPDNSSDELRALLAARLRVPDECVVVGAGSIGLLQALLSAVCEPDSTVVYGWRSFEAFPVLARLAGAVGVPVPLCEHRMDLDAIASAVDDRTRAVVICNPNNPTGTVVGSAELIAFVGALPPDCLVILDEAYHDYVAGAGTADGVDLVRAHRNVATVRTFSKAHGLAGLRVGYLVADPAVTEAATKTQLPFAVSRLAQVAAAASLRAEDELAERVRTLVGERERIRHCLTSFGLATPESYGNFVWLPVGERAAELAAACRGDGLAVHSFAGEGVRVTVDTEAANDRFLRVAREFGDACGAESATRVAAVAG